MCELQDTFSADLGTVFFLIRTFLPFLDVMMLGWDLDRGNWHWNFLVHSREKGGGISRG